MTEKEDETIRKKRRLNLVLVNPRDQTFRRIQLIVLLALLYLIFPQKAYAYLDPGTFGYIIQLIMAAIVGTLVVAKQLRNKIKIFFKHLFSKAKKHEKTED